MFNLIRKHETSEQPLAQLRDEFEALFDRFLGRWPAPLDVERGMDRLWGLNVEDRDNEIIVRADLPGFEVDDINVEFGGRQLTIKAEKKEEGQKTGNGRGEERAYRSFHRSVTLPEGVKADGIKAEYHNGVLEVHLPKREEAKPKRIPVKG